MPMSDDRESRAVELANQAVKLVVSGQSEVHIPVFLGPPQVADCAPGRTALGPCEKLRR